MSVLVRVQEGDIGTQSTLCKSALPLSVTVRRIVLRFRDSLTAQKSCWFLHYAARAIGHVIFQHGRGPIE
jgi:hypothetical protein